MTTLVSLSPAAYHTHVELLDGAYSQLDLGTSVSTSIRSRCHIHREDHCAHHIRARLFTLHCALVDSSKQSFTWVTDMKLSWDKRRLTDIWAGDGNNRQRREYGIEMPHYYITAPSSGVHRRSFSSPADLQVWYRRDRFHTSITRMPKFHARRTRYCIHRCKTMELCLSESENKKRLGYSSFKLWSSFFRYPGALTFLVSSDWSQSRGLDDLKLEGRQTSQDHLRGRMILEDGSRSNYGWDGGAWSRIHRELCMEPG